MKIYRNQVQAAKEYTDSKDNVLAQSISQLSAQLDPTKKYKIVACILYNDAGTWKVISDSEHVPMHVSSVSNDTDDITITYDFTASHVLSFVACPDETFVAAGYEFGSSVGLSTSVITIRKNPSVIGGYVYYDGSAWDRSTNATGFTGASFNAGTLTLNHASMDGYIVNAVCRDGVYLVGVGSLGTTSLALKMFDYAGNLITTADTNMKLYVQRAEPSKVVNPTTLLITGANIWCYGLFEVA